jgi:hypothetical protein
MQGSESGVKQAGLDRTEAISAIVEAMRASWDTPVDCNDGELFAYAEILFDRIEAGEDRATLEAYLAEVQTGELGMPATSAPRDIVARAMTSARTPR